MAVLLASEKTIRGRTVYSLIELVSEVSGLYDIYNLVAGLFLVFYTSQVQRAEMIQEMIQVRGRKPVKLGAKNLRTDLISELGRRFSLHSNLWLTITSGICPRLAKVGKDKKLVKLHEQAIERIDRSLDIARQIEIQQDMQLLLESLFTPAQLWLFKAKSKRLV